MHSDVVRRFMEHSTFQNASYQWQNRFEKKVMPDENFPETQPFDGPVEVEVPEALKVNVEEMLDTFRLALRYTNCPRMMECDSNLRPLAMWFMQWLATRSAWGGRHLKLRYS